MQRLCGIESISQCIERQRLFLIDLRADFFLIVNDKIFPLHKKYLEPFPYFKYLFSSNPNIRIHRLEKAFSVLIVEKVLGYIYGIQCQIQRNKEIIEFLEIVALLGIDELRNQVISKIKESFEQYGIFILLSIAELYNIEWLKQKCYKQLISLNFEQINFNFYELLQCDQKIFQKIIQLHQTLQLKGKIKGIGKHQIKNIISQYSQANHISLNVGALLMPFTEAIRETDSQYSSEVDPKTPQPLSRSSKINALYVIEEKAQITESTLSGSYNISDQSKQNQNFMNKNQEFYNNMEKDHFKEINRKFMEDFDRIITPQSNSSEYEEYGFTFSQTIQKFDGRFVRLIQPKVTNHTKKNKTSQKRKRNHRSISPPSSSPSPSTPEFGQA